MQTRDAIHTQADFDLALTEQMGEFYDDPYGFVLYSFPWGEPGGPLEHQDGPDIWQRDQMLRIRDAFRADPECTIREAIASGHGIGKSAEVAWLILWAMSTRPMLSGVVTANTSSQLSSKTWRELALWHERMIHKHWFTWTATKFFHKEHPSTWVVAAIPNTEHNSEAFAGLHAEHVLLLYDEASAIPDIIWEVSEGAMTTPKAMWFAFGNPTKNTGRFRACFREDAHRWSHHQIDSRTCKMTNKSELEEMIGVYGEDSDFVRVRIKGEFPRTGTMQFMPSDIVDMAMATEIPPEVYMTSPIVIGVDVARFGEDKTCIAIRQGRKILNIFKYRELNTMQTATKVAQLINDYQPHAVFVDGVGVGAGVVDRLHQLSYDVIEVNAGKGPDDKEVYYNKRAEMWDRMRVWMRNGADIPSDPELRSALIGVEYGFDEKERMRLERKQDMKSRGLDSPDEGDAVAHTFAEILGDNLVNHFEPDNFFEPEMVA